MAENMLFVAVIPAAGLSSRMGRFKPLLPFGDSTVIETSVGTALSYVDKAAVILGKRSEELSKLLSSRFSDKLILAENRDYETTDMLTSVKIGLCAIGACDACFILPADMPGVASDVYTALANAFDKDDEVLIPVIGGRKGHPVLISSALIPRVIAYSGDMGLKGFFKECKVRYIPVDNKGIIIDLDTPEDYKNIRNADARLTDKA